MQVLGILFGLAVCVLGARLILRSEDSHRRYKDIHGIIDTEREQDETYVSYVIQFFVGLVVIFIGIAILSYSA